MLGVLSPGEGDRISRNVDLAFQDSVSTWMAENKVPCAGIGIIENGKIRYLKVFGELQKGDPAPPNAIFNIASQTKPVVAMLVLKLVQAGQWSLDEPLFHYWVDPDVAGDTLNRILTTRHVLSHQTGFANWRVNEPSRKLRFDFRPGTAFQYSGEGFEYLRKALELRFKKPLEKLLDSLVFQPLGMKDTRYWSSGVDTTRFAHWHNGNGERYNVSEKTGKSAADDLLTTVEDYCKFGIDVINGAGLSDTLFSDIVRPQVELRKNYYRGLGWGLVEGLPDGEYALEHGGSDIGVRTMAVFLPLSRRGVVVMTNGDNGMNVFNHVIRSAVDVGQKILENMYQSPTAHKAVVLPAGAVEEVVGTYVQPNGGRMTVAGEGNAIRLSGDGIPTLVLYPESETRFFSKEFDGQIEFIKDMDGNVVKLATYENGKKGIEATRRK